MNRPGPARTGQDACVTFWSRLSEAYFSVPVGDTSFCSYYNLEQLYKIVLSEHETIISKNL